MYPINSKKNVAWLVLIMSIATQTCFASNTAGIFGPGVTEGERSAQYRTGYDPDNNDFIQRVHYQHALNNRVRLRGVFQARKTEDSDVDFDFFQGELQWQLKGNAKRQQALRFDVQIKDRNRVSSLGVNWSNQFTLSPTLSARAIALTVVEIGNGAKSGVLLRSRANVSHKLNNRFNVSVELFSDYGSSTDFRSFDDQVHQIGPAVSGKLSGDWGFFSGVLVGATDASPDTSLRLWLSKSFK